MFQSISAATYLNLINFLKAIPDTLEVVISLAH